MMRFIPSKLPEKLINIKINSNFFTVRSNNIHGMSYDFFH